MMRFDATEILEFWPVWLVSIVLVVAAVIDGRILKVPNWLTLPFILSGWLHGFIYGGVSGFGASLLGTTVGLSLLVFLRAVGGMGGGDVKLLAGVGAWLGVSATWWAFVWTTIIGGVIALGMIVHSGRYAHHWQIGRQILREWLSIRQPEKLAAIARQRKPSMQLLPYGIPMAIGSILYFAFAGMLI